MDFSQLNNSLNNVLDPIFGTKLGKGFLMMFLFMFGGLAAPKLPLSWAPVFTNSLFRVLFLAMLVWISNKDPTVAIVCAGVFMLTMHYFTQNAIKHVAQTGVVSPEVAIVISGGSGPSIKSKDVVQAEARLMQASVDASKAAGFVTPPQATLSSSTSNTIANTSIPNVPSGTPATSTSMMAASPSGGIPTAVTPDHVHDLAKAPA